MNATVINISERRRAAEERAGGSPLGVFGDVVEGVRNGTLTAADPLERAGHAQGNTQGEKDRRDGERDALRVLAGKKPLKPLGAIATADYTRGWNDAASMAAG